MKKIYFACSIRGGRDDDDIYEKLVSLIRSEAEVLTEIFTDKKLTPAGMKKPSPEIWKNDLDWVQEADAMIAEVSTPSLGVGYEIAKAENWGKPILCLYKPQSGKKLSAMIDGSPNLTVSEYHDILDTEKIIKEFLKTL